MGNENIRSNAGKVKKGSPRKKAEPQLSNDELRKRKKQLRMRKKRIRRLVLTFASVITAVIVCVILMLAFLFTVKTIEVKGETRYTDAMIIEKSGISEGDSLYLMNEKKIKAAVETGLPYVKELTITKKFPDGLILTVKSAKEIAAISSGGSYVVIDKDCKVLNEKLSMLSESDVVVSGISVVKAEAGKTLEIKKAERLSALSAVLGAIDENGFKRITEINVKDVKDIKVVYDNRITLIVGGVDDISSKMGRAKAVVKAEDENNPHIKGEADLRDGKQIIFTEAEEKPEKPKKDKTDKKTQKKQGS